MLLECKKHHVCENDHVWNSATCRCENGKYLASIVDDSAIICDDVSSVYIKEARTKLSFFLIVY